MPFCNLESSGRSWERRTPTPREGLVHLHTAAQLRMFSHVLSLPPKKEETWSHHSHALERSLLVPPSRPLNVLISQEFAHQKRDIKWRITETQGSGQKAQDQGSLCIFGGPCVGRTSETEHGLGLGLWLFVLVCDAVHWSCHRGVLPFSSFLCWLKVLKGDHFPIRTALRSRPALRRQPSTLQADAQLGGAFGS